MNDLQSLLKKLQPYSRYILAGLFGLQAIFTLFRLIDSFQLVTLFNLVAYGLTAGGLLYQKQPILTAAGFGLQALTALWGMVFSVIFSFINVISFRYLLQVLFNLVANGVGFLATLALCAFGVVLLTEYLPTWREKACKYRFAPVLIRILAVFLSAVSSLFFYGIPGFLMTGIRGILPVLTAAALILLPPQE